MAATPLQHIVKSFVQAAFVGDIDAIDVYLARPDGNPNVPNQMGQTALVTASRCRSRSKSVAIVTRLLDVGASVHTEDGLGNTPLHHMSFRGQCAIVERLLALGAEIEYRNKLFRTPLMYAAWNGQAEMVTLLIDAGAKIQVSDYEKRSVLHFAIRDKFSTNVEVVRILLHAGIDTCVVDMYKRTALDQVKLWSCLTGGQRHDQQQIVNVFHDWLANSDKMLAFVDGLTNPASGHTSTAMTRFAAHTTFDLNVVGLIFGCLDGQPHCVDFAARSLKHQATGRAVSTRPLKRAKW